MTHSRRQVFDGKKGSYVEGCDDAMRSPPVNAYGASKLAAELAALSLPCSVVLRLSLVYGPPTPRGGNKTSTFLQFMDASLGNASAAALQLFSDEIRCPIAITDVCDACCRLISLFSGGLELLQPYLHQRLHCGGPTALSRVAMGEIVCSTRGYSFRDRVQSVTRDEAMADAAFKFNSPPDISMKGRLFQQLLQVTAVPLLKSSADGSFRAFIDATSQLDTSIFAPRAPHTRPVNAAGSDKFRRGLRCAAAARARARLMHRMPDASSKKLVSWQRCN